MSSSLHSQNFQGSMLWFKVFLRGTIGRCTRAVKGGVKGCHAAQVAQMLTRSPNIDYITALALAHFKRNSPEAREGNNFAAWL